MTTTILNTPTKTPAELVRSIACADYETLMQPEPPSLEDSLEVWEDALADEPDDVGKFRAAVDELGLEQAREIYRNAYVAEHERALSGERR